jgi:uncharacterized protein (UPF0332 family)
MNEKQLKRLLENPKLVDARLKFYLEKNLLKKQPIDEAEVAGHVEKSEHNLKFIQSTLEQGFSDWGIVGCYYAAYHIALSLLLKKGYSSKNHDATLCVLIKHYYREITEDDLELLNKIYLDNSDVLFYVSSKYEREKASYSSERLFDKKIVSELRFKTIHFVNKCKEILKKLS